MLILLLFKTALSIRSSQYAFGPLVCFVTALLRRPTINQSTATVSPPPSSLCSLTGLCPPYRSQQLNAFHNKQPSASATMRYTSLILALSATALSVAIPHPAAAPKANAEAAPAPVAIPSLSDGHQVTNPSFDPNANFDLDALYQKGAGMAAKEDYPAPAIAGNSVGGSYGLSNSQASNGAGMKSDMDEIERMLGGQNGNGMQKRDVGYGEDDGVDLGLDDGGEQDLEKRATLTSYLLYCLRFPKKCRAVKVKGR